MHRAQCPTGTSRRHRPPAHIASHRPWPWLALAVCARRAAWSARSRLQIALAYALSGARWPIRTAQWSSGVPSTGPPTRPRASDRPWPQLAAARACLPSRARCSASLVAARCCAGGATGGRLAAVKTAEMDPQHPNCLTGTQEGCVCPKGPISLQPRRNFVTRVKYHPNPGDNGASDTTRAF